MIPRFDFSRRLASSSTSLRSRWVRTCCLVLGAILVSVAPATGDRFTVDTERLLRIESLTVDTTTEPVAGDRVPIVVTGTYENGETTDLTDSPLLTYVVEPSTAATVDRAAGELVAQEGGAATLRVTYLNDGWIDIRAEVALSIQLPGDRDADGMSDDFETANGFDPDQPADALADHDEDGLTNREEFDLATFPRDPDTDNDGRFDGNEVADGTDPRVADPPNFDPDDLDPSCLVSVLNRTARVDPDGVWVIPNVPSSLGQVRVRATCVRDDGLKSGQSGFFTVPEDGVVRVDDIVFDIPAPVADRLEISAPVTTLTADTPSAQLTVTAFYGDTTTADLTAASTGTNYRTSNPALATVDPEGVLTAHASGVVLVTAANEGANGFARFTLVLSADSDGDGIPDDLELALGLDPNDPIDALEDLDRDGLSTLDEIQLGLDPRDPDSDDDGLRDGAEGTFGTDPLIFDTDGDGLSDGLEVQLGSDPLDPNDFDLDAAVESIALAPSSFNLVFNTVFGEASIQLEVTGRLIDGSEIDLTARGTGYTSSDLAVCNFGLQPGQVFAGADGSCTVTASVAGQTADAAGSVSSFSPTPLSTLSLPGQAQSVDVVGDVAHVAVGSAGLALVDVSDRSAPVLLGTVDTPGTARDVRVEGTVAYVADGGAGLTLIDVSNPATATVLATLDTPGNALDVEVRGALAYVADGNQGLRIVDVSNPVTPTEVGSIGSLGTLGVIRGLDVSSSRGLAVLAEGPRVRVVDVSAPQAPALLGTATIGGDAQDVALGGGDTGASHAYVADRSRSLTVVDLAQPGNPIVGTSTPRETGGLLVDLVRRGDLLFGADIFFVNGVPVVQIGDPSAPRPTAILDFQGFGDDNGSGIGVDDQFVYLTTTRSNLMIGRYLSLQDSAGVPPRVRLISPVGDEDPVAGTQLALSATASDDVGVLRVDFLVDGAVAFTDFTSPYAFDLDVPPGAPSIEVTARALDYGGNLATTDPVTVAVVPDTAAPTIGLVTPAAGTPFTSGDAMTLTAEVTDNVAVGEVVFRVGGREFVDTMTPFEVTVSTPPVFETTDLAIQVEAFDPSDNSSRVDFTVPVEPIEDNEPPRPRLVSPGDGDSVLAGQALTVQVAITDDRFLDRYTLTLDGQPIGGQDFIEQPSFNDTLDLTLPATALPGEQFTFRLEAVDFGGNTAAVEATVTVIDGSGVLTGNQTLDSSFDGQSLVLGTGTFTLAEPVTLADLTMLSGARLRASGGVLALEVTGRFQFGTGAVIDQAFRGFGGGSAGQVGGRPSGLTGSTPDAGGSHGGAGLRFQAGAGGEVYDSVFVPQLAGGGGAGDNDCCGNGRPGGGVVELVAGEMVLNGTIDVRGQGGGQDRAGGAGGSVLITTTTLSGSGTINASGGTTVSGGEPVGPGGGGRVALYTDTLVGFDPTLQVRVHGGTRDRTSGGPNGFAAPGTIYVLRADSIHGDLIVDNGVDGGGADRPSASTELPGLGAGAVTALTPDGGDAWLAGGSAFRQRWLGAQVRLFDATDGDLGLYRVGDLDGSGELLLVGAGPVTGAVRYAGEYHFDRIDLLHGAGLQATDPMRGEVIEVERGTSELPARFTAGTLTLRENSRVIPASGGVLRGEVTGTLTVEPGARFDVSNRGFGGGTAGQQGGAPGGVSGATPDAGGSHGGRGLGFQAGNGGPVYDSVYAPQLAGGGGAGDNDCCGTGRPGGGVIELVANELVLDGSILARGESGGQDRAAGAGGSVWISATTLRGSGSIDVSGGTTVSGGEPVGPGGGGRIAIWADSLVGFDPQTQAIAHGGTRDRTSGGPSGFAAPGTIYVRTAASTYGDLLVDNGVDGAGADRPSASTELPTLGDGAVVALTPAGADAWLEAGSALPQRWLGAWVRLLDGADGDLGFYRAAGRDASGRILLEGAGAVSGAARFVGEYRFDRIDLFHGAGVLSNDPVTSTTVEVAAGSSELPIRFTTTDLTLRTGSRAIPASGGTLRAEVTGTLTIEAGAILDVSSRGFGGATAGQVGGAPSGIDGSTPDAGGSHGGAGLRFQAGAGGEVYDSVYVPQLAGGGGAGDNDCCGTGRPGGGVIELSAGDLVLDGQILARGQGGGQDRAAGAGGSVLITTTTLSGGGLIDVSGGTTVSGGEPVGPGGGGRIAIYADTLVGFDPVTQTVARGGTRDRTSGGPSGFAAPGTVFVHTGISMYGDLLIDNGVDGAGDDRPSASTELPGLGAGTVVSFTPAGDDAWLMADSGLQQRWLGAWIQLLDAADGDLGTYRVADRDGSGQILVEGAGLVVGAARFVGEYRFDRVDLRHGAGLLSRDPVEGMDLEVGAGQAELPASFMLSRLTLRTGAHVTVVEGSTLRGVVSGTMTIEAGASLNVSGRGYAGNTAGQPGGAPAGIAGSTPDAGGSHGGRGLGFQAGNGGPVYDSVYVPQLSGGGGAGDNDCCGTGRPGGGVIDLDVGSLVLEGEILARGQGGGQDRAAGAGGSIVVRAGTLSGSGRIDASGGTTVSGGEPVGPGGGGRVALWVGTLSGFDPGAQVQVYGGTRDRTSGGPNGYAAPGTLYVHTDGSTDGDLWVDNGVTGGGGDRPSVATALPQLGSGTVVGTSDAGADLWLASDTPFLQRWVGAWMRLRDGSGADLGLFRVLDRDGAGQLLLEGAAGVTGATDYVGEYRFDRIDLRHGSGISSQDPVTGQIVEVGAGVSELPNRVSTTDFLLRTGSRAVPASGSLLAIEASGTITVETGASLDVSSRGYPGSAAGQRGGAPANVTGSSSDAGGSHAGRGLQAQAGSGGETYGSLFWPLWAGGGGAGDNDCCGDGRAGGGILTLDVDTLVLEGSLLARGQTGSNDHTAGAGGSILVQATTVSGAGLMDASGGSTSYGGEPVGPGGGGRVALYADTLVGFDPATQIISRGGSRTASGSTNGYAGAGTVYVSTASSLSGDLRVDQGGTFGRTTAQTPLPAVGSGLVGVTEIDGDDPQALWIEPQDPAARFALGVVGSEVRIDGVDYPVVDQTNDRRRVLLEGAAGLVDPGDAYQGVLRLDSVTVRGGAILVLDDEPVIDVIDVDAESTLIDNSP